MDAGNRAIAKATASSSFACAPSREAARSVREDIGMNPKPPKHNEGIELLLPSDVAGKLMPTPSRIVFDFSRCNSRPCFLNGRSGFFASFCPQGRLICCSRPCKAEASWSTHIGAFVVETGELPMKIRDSVAFVTGANRGIGLAFVQELLAGGARKVYAAARQPERITFAGVERVRLDVTNPEDVAAAARQCTDVNLLINNAGIALRTGFLAPDSVEASRSEMGTNYYGPLLLSRAFAPVLAKNGGGAIVNLLSVLSWVAAGTCSASKAAEWALTNWLRTALREQGTQVVGVHAALVDTDMRRGLPLPKVKPVDVVRQALSAVEAGRDEVLADDLTRQVKAGLSDREGIYLNFDPLHAVAPRGEKLNLIPPSRLYGDF